MWTYPNIDPIALRLGPVEIHWYALSYLAGFLVGWAIAKYICRRDANQFRPNSEDVDDFMSWAILSVLLGGRIGYILFYNLPYYLDNPLGVVQVWKGGMSFHGALVGLISTIILYAVIKKISVLRLADLASVAAPIGFFFGRIANFVNGELYGRVTDSQWGMVFPDGGPLPRHPSQLYEAVLEGAVLFTIVFSLAHVKKIRHSPGLISAAFLFFYGLFRFMIEYVREPDAQLGLFADTFSMGQLLCMPMMAGGIFMIFVSRYFKKKNDQPA